MEFGEFLPWSDLSDHEEKIVEQRAYLQEQRDTINSNLAGDICTDSESDDPEAWVGVHDFLSPEGQALIRKHRSIIRRKAKRIVSKEIAHKSLLRRRPQGEYLGL